MRLFVIHGDYHIKSYDRLQKYIAKAKQNIWEIVKIDRELLENNKSLPVILSGQSLFTRERLFVLEGIKLLTVKDLKWLKKHNQNLDGNLVIYDEAVIPETILKNLPEIKKIENFKLPKNIFNFLEAFYPKNSQECLKLMTEILKTEPLEFVFSLLAKQVRDLYWVKVSPANIPYPSWRVEKLERQANKYSEQLLKEIISQLTEIDVKVKTSQASLIDSLDFLIISKLE